MLNKKQYETLLVTVEKLDKPIADVSGCDGALDESDTILDAYIWNLTQVFGDLLSYLTDAANNASDESA